MNCTKKQLTGISIKTFTLCFRFRIYLLNGKFYAHVPIPIGWTHIVLNYIGSNDGEGIRISYDGQEVANSTTKDEGSYPAEDSRIVVGRSFTDEDRRYASMQIDELIFFNTALSTTDIKVLYNVV